MNKINKELQETINAISIENCYNKLDQLYENYNTKIDIVLSYVSINEGKEFMQFHKFYFKNIKNIKIINSWKK